MVLPSFTIGNLFLNPSWIAFRSNFHGHPKSNWLACIGTFTHNLIRILPNSKHNKYLLSNLHFNTCIQPLQSTRPRMLNTTQIQFLHKSTTSYISTTTSIDYHATYLVLDVTSSVKYVFPLLIYNIFDLHVQCTPYNQGLPLNRIWNLLITTIHQRWHLFTFRLVTLRFNLPIISCKHNSSVWTLICNMPLP
jgi:hypothetical protein